MNQLKYFSVIGLLVVSNVFSSQKLTSKLTLINDTGRVVHMVYAHEKSPDATTPDRIVIAPCCVRRLPCTHVNPKTIGLVVEGALLADYDAINVPTLAKYLVLKELIPGQVALFYNENPIAQLRVK
jgi:hypothetical protein